MSFTTSTAMDLWPRIEKAIDATVLSRASVEWQFPECHRKSCPHGNHGDPWFVLRLFVAAVKESVRTELLCEAVTNPDDQYPEAVR